jgi:hypothetical protein
MLNETLAFGSVQQKRAAEFDPLSFVRHSEIGSVTYATAK